MSNIKKCVALDGNMYCGHDMADTTVHPLTHSLTHSHINMNEEARFQPRDHYLLELSLLALTTTTRNDNS